MTNPPTTHSHRSLFAVAIAGMLLMTAACSAGSDKRADAESSAGSTSRPAASATTTRASGSATTEPTSTSAPKGKKEILGTSTGQQPADPNDQTPVALRLDITSVKRSSGDAVEVRFDLTNTGEEDIYKPYSTVADPTVQNPEYDVGGLTLLDLANDKKYLTLVDTDGICLCSTVDSLELEPGKSISLYANVTAPPKSTSTVDISLPGFSPITGLEIR